MVHLPDAPPACNGRRAPPRGPLPPLVPRPPPHRPARHSTPPGTLPRG